MTSDPKAPGAKEVYLTLEDNLDDGSKTRTYYERIKVLTEKGKEAATVRFTHDPDTKFEVEARTIHVDGTVIPMTDKPADLVEFKTKDEQVNSHSGVPGQVQVSLIRTVPHLDDSAAHVRAQGALLV